MIGTIIGGCVKDILLTMANNRRYTYSPDLLYKAAGMNPQAKILFKRNLQSIPNNAKIKNLLKQLEREINAAMNK